MSDNERRRWVNFMRVVFILFILGAAFWAWAFWAALTFYLSPARAEVIRNDGGGDVAEYTIRANLAVLRGEMVVIDGWCASACVMFLRAGCVTPRAVLAFHSPEGGTRADRQRARKTLARHMPPAMGAWYLAGPANHPAVVTLDAAAAIEMGATPCGR